MGSALTVVLDVVETLKTCDEVNVRIDYSTTLQCTAIGWLEKEYVQSFLDHPGSLTPLSTAGRQLARILNFSSLNVNP